MQRLVLPCLWLVFALMPAVLSAASEVALDIDPRSAHQASVEALAEGVFSVVTTGGDPHVTTRPLPEGVRLPDAAVLSFEYFCPEGLDHLELFFGAPFRSGFSVKGGPLAAAEVWRPVTLNPGALSAGKWTGRERQFRLDFGSKPGVRLQLRNLCFREMTPGEQAGVDAAKALKRRKADDAAAIQAYLKRGFSSRIASVRLEGGSLSILGRVGSASSGGFWLAELGMHEEPWRETALTHSITVKPRPDGSFQMLVPRFEAGRDRLFSRWQLLEETPAGPGSKRVASHAMHADFLPDSSELVPLNRNRKTKKGMGGVVLNPIASELQELGVEHVTVNIVLNRFFRSVAGPGTELYRFEGRDYALSKSAVEGMDRTLSFFSGFAEVSAILLIGFPEEQQDRALLNHPEATSPGVYAMPNLTTAEGVHAYRAALAFLAGRYKGGGGGRITHWILHNEIDQAFAWTNMGEQPMDIVMDHYVRSMRLAYLSAREANPEAKVFISLTHHWNAPEGTSFQHYRPKEMLDRLVEYSRLEGDFEWGVAYHPYPQSLFHAATWEDKRALFSFDTPYITLKNIEVLDAYLHRQPLLYGGVTPRSVLLSEQGFHTNDASETAQRLQAAALVYTWHKIRALPTIEAFHNHRWMDAKDEGGLLLGLRTLSEPQRPFGNKKFGWNVYRALDTAEEETACAFAREVLGVADFSEIPYRGPIPEYPVVP